MQRLHLFDHKCWDFCNVVYLTTATLYGSIVANFFEQFGLWILVVLEFVGQNVCVLNICNLVFLF
jgi:hypothetical protein